MRPWLSCLLFFASLLPLPLLATPGAAAERCPVPKKLSFRVDGEIRRDAVGFTQGLEVRDGLLYESTGNFFGNTQINRIDTKTGHVSVLMNAGKSYFGEGMTFFGDRLYQMTYRENQVYVFDKNMRRLPTLSNPREGWGLTHDESQLIASDGSNRLYFLSPQDFSVRRILPVFDQGRRVSHLNELEYVQGAIWANVFEDWDLVRISPVTGCVEARANLEPLRARMSAADRDAIDADGNFVPNGIAYNPADGVFTITGKYWPMLYTGRFVEAK
jgi:glutamine cyclotransferase